MRCGPCARKVLDRATPPHRTHVLASALSCAGVSAAAAGVVPSASVLEAVRELIDSSAGLFGPGGGTAVLTDASGANFHVQLPGAAAGGGWARLAGG